MCEINVVANRNNHHKLASNMACYALAYLKNTYCQSAFKTYFHNLELVEQRAFIDPQILQSHIKQLRKARYQVRVKKGHFYQFNYVVSSIILSVFETYSDKDYQNYNYFDFKNFLTYPVCRHTVTLNLPEGTLAQLQKGEVIDLYAFDLKLKGIKSKELYMDEYCV
jgi:hypothetical protein